MGPSSKPRVLRPPFATRWQRNLFVAFVALLLALPLVPSGRLIDRARLYRLLPGGKYDDFATRLLGDSGSLDVVFLVGTRGAAAIDARAVRAGLPAGAEVAVVERQDDDPVWDYFAARDLLERRPVRLLVVEVGDDTDGHASDDAATLWDAQLHADLLARLPLDERAGLYADRVRAALRRLTAPLRSTELLTPSVCRRAEGLGACPVAFAAAAPATQLGPLLARTLPASRRGVRRRAAFAALAALGAARGARLAYLAVPADDVIHHAGSSALAARLAADLAALPGPPAVTP